MIISGSALGIGKQLICSPLINHDILLNQGSHQGIYGHTQERKNYTKVKVHMTQNGLLQNRKLYCVEIM